MSRRVHCVSFVARTVLLFVLASITGMSVHADIIHTMRAFIDSMLFPAQEAISAHAQETEETFEVIPSIGALEIQDFDQVIDREMGRAGFDLNTMINQAMRSNEYQLVKQLLSDPGVKIDLKYRALAKPFNEFLALAHRTIEQFEYNNPAILQPRSLLLSVNGSILLRAKLESAIANISDQYAGLRRIRLQNTILGEALLSDLTSKINALLTRLATLKNNILGFINTSNDQREAARLTLTFSNVCDTINRTYKQHEIWAMTQCNMSGFKVVSWCDAVLFAAQKNHVRALYEHYMHQRAQLREQVNLAWNAIIKFSESSLAKKQNDRIFNLLCNTFGEQNTRRMPHEELVGELLKDQCSRERYPQIAVVLSDIFHTLDDRIFQALSNALAIYAQPMLLVPFYGSSQAQVQQLMAGQERSIKQTLNNLFNVNFRMTPSDDLFGADQTILALKSLLDWVNNIEAGLTQEVSAKPWYQIW